MFSQKRLEEIQQKFHPNCWICGFNNNKGLKLKFQMTDKGHLSFSFDADKRVEGYTGLLHGGAVAAILDEAMGNCLFAYDHIAYTADFRLRFKRPVSINNRITVHAWIVKSRFPLHKTKAELSQCGIVKAIATAKFMEEK